MWRFHQCHFQNTAKTDDSLVVEAEFVRVDNWSCQNAFDSSQNQILYFSTTLWIVTIKILLVHAVFFTRLIISAVKTVLTAAYNCSFRIFADVIVEIF